MGHRCCSKQKVKRGLWSPEEDDKLVKHITTHGHGSWSSVPKLANLQRCGKSCRLRWINYLRPDLKKGSFTEEEEQIIIDVHRILGNRWAQIAKHLPGRTDNEVKNFWNSCIKKKLMSQGLDPQTHNLLSSHHLRASNSDHKKNGVSSFVVSHDSHEQQPVSVFSMTSSSSQDHQVSPFDLTLPSNAAAISTADHDHHHYQNPQNYYDIPSSSSSSRAHAHRHPSTSALIDQDFSIWDSSSFDQPSFEANRQALINGHDHHHGDQQEMNHENQEKGQIRNNETPDHDQEKHSSFDLGFMESALMSDFVYNNDFSSVEYDITWNY